MEGETGKHGGEQWDLTMKSGRMVQIRRQRSASIPMHEAISPEKHGFIAIERTTHGFIAIERTTGLEVIVHCSEIESALAVPIQDEVAS